MLATKTTEHRWTVDDVLWLSSPSDVFLFSSVVEPIFIGTHVYEMERRVNVSLLPQHDHCGIFLGDELLLVLFVVKIVVFSKT
jgi:hypothetical protein